MLWKLPAAQGLTQLCPPYMLSQYLMASGKLCPLFVEWRGGECWADWRVLALVPASLLRKAPLGETGIPCQTLMGLG